MAGVNPHATQRLEQLLALLDDEERTVRARTDALMKDRTPKELEASGLLLRQACVSDVAPALFGGARVTLTDAKDGQVARFDVRPGAVVWLMEKDDDGALVQTATGVVVRKNRTQLQVVLDSAQHAAVIEDRVFVLRVSDEVTVRRMKDGVRQLMRADGRTARLCEVLLGGAPARATRPGNVTLDATLNADQQQAVLHGLYADDVGLIHGPPGTGKTRAVVEVVLQCVARGERVLAMAASNAAVDHLAVSLLDAQPQLSLARLGHPARAHPALELHTLAALTDAHDHKRIARALTDQAFELLRTANKRSSRGSDGHQQKREARAQAGALFADARRLQRQAAQAVLAQSKVLCGTLTGSLDVLGDAVFDTLVVDEASQVLTPALLLPLRLCKRVVLAGDHHQLPPTVLSDSAAKAGLSDTVFGALTSADRAGAISRMLTVQHRMHTALMAFVSARFYDGALVAHHSVAHHTLADLVAAPNDATQALLAWQHPLDVIDTAGSGHEEQRTPGGDSFDNPGEASVVAALVHAFVAVGIAPSDIGVIAPYAGQVAVLLGLLSDVVEAGLEVDSVDGFQGREKQLVVFSAVRSNPDGQVGFLADVRRLNVALSRARRKLCVVADSATLSANPTWRALFDAAMATGAYRSVFELALA